MFNETPVVGGPLGFIAADWHLDAVCSGWGLGRAWQAVGITAEPAAPCKPGLAAFPELSVQGHSHMFPTPREHCTQPAGGRAPGSPWPLLPTKHQEGHWAFLPSPSFPRSQRVDEEAEAREVK